MTIQNSIQYISHHRSQLTSHPEKSWQGKIKDVLDKVFLPNDAQLTISIKKHYSGHFVSVYKWSKENRKFPKIIRIVMGKIFSFKSLLLTKAFSVSINNETLILTKGETSSLNNKVDPLIKKNRSVNDIIGSFMVKKEGETIRIRVSKTLCQATSDAFETFDYKWHIDNNLFDNKEHITKVQFEYPNDIADKIEDFGLYTITKEKAKEVFGQNIDIEPIVYNYN